MSTSLNLSDRFCRDRTRVRRDVERGRTGSRRVPRIESLERRALLAAAIFEVTNLDDDGPGSLRNAIEAANVNPGADCWSIRGRPSSPRSRSSTTWRRGAKAESAPGAERFSLASLGRSMSRCRADWSRGIPRSAAEEDPEAAELVKLRLFAGVSLSEAGEMLGMSRSGAYRAWDYVRAWFTVHCA